GQGQGLWRHQIGPRRRPPRIGSLADSDMGGIPPRDAPMPRKRARDRTERSLMPSEGPAIFLQARGLSKTFGHVQALRDVSLDVHENDILAIVGDNGAGKSTLTKILSGVYLPDQGDIQVKGQPVRIANPRKARELGIATVFQNLALVDGRDVAGNLYLGREPTRFGFLLDRRKMIADSREVIGRLRVTIPSVTVEAGQLSGGQRQSIAIGRAASQDARVIIM